MEVKLHFKRYYVFTKYKYISQQLKIPTVQQGTTILDVLEPHPPPPHPTLSSPCKLPGTVLSDWQGCNWQLKNCCNLRWLKKTFVYILRTTCIPSNGPTSFQVSYISLSLEFARGWEDERHSQ